MRRGIYIVPRYKSIELMAKQVRLTLAEYRALAAIRRGMREFLEFSAGAALATGLTPAQHQALRAIKGMPEPATVGTLAEWLGVRPHSAVGLVNRLVTLKLLQRVVDRTDRRRMRL